MANPLAVSALTTEQLLLPVTGSDGYTSLPVEVSLVRAGLTPDVDDWHVGSWVDGQAALLIGPDGDVTYPPGLYRPRVRIDGGLEVPVLKFRMIRITPN